MPESQQCWTGSHSLRHRPARLGNARKPFQLGAFLGTGPIKRPSPSSVAVEPAEPTFVAQVLFAEEGVEGPLVDGHGRFARMGAPV